MNRFVFAFLPALLTSCTPDSDPANTDDVVAQNPYGATFECPALVDGENVITVNGLDRDLHLALPANPEGAPVVFAWHWLGGDADQIMSWMGVRGMTATGAIVVAPESTHLPAEWDLLVGPDTSIDVALFDQLLGCLWEQHHVDADRVFSTGMSAGGLFTSYLTQYRSEVLAASAPFSGGINASFYSSPTTTLPVMLSWGGETDQYGQYDFNAATQWFSQSLRDEGHFVVECNHGLGHLPPPDATAMAWTFFAAHPRGVSPEPWASALPSALPSYCAIP